MKNKNLFWLFALSAAIYFAQGIKGIPGLSFFAYLKEHLHFNESTIMYLSSLISISWLVKPLWGFLCDNYWIKKKWIIFSLIGSMLTALTLGLMVSLPFLVITTLLIFDDWNSAIRDVATDGTMCCEGKEQNECCRIQAIQWISITVAGIIASLAGGYIADHFSYRPAFLILLPIYLVIIGIVLRYKPTKQEERVKIKFLEAVKSYRVLFIDKRFLFGCLFLFLYNFNPSFGTPLGFIERDKFHWSWTFMGTLGAITSGASIIGSLLYFKFGKKINIVKWLFWSVLFGSLATLLYLYFTPVTAVIYRILFSAIGMFIFLNLMSWMAESTIAGKEATSFALLCSVSNLSATCSNLTGAWLFPLIGLKWLIIISSLTSFSCLLFIRRIR